MGDKFAVGVSNMTLGGNSCCTDYKQRTSWVLQLQMIVYDDDDDRDDNDDDDDDTCTDNDGEDGVNDRRIMYVLTAVHNNFFLFIIRVLRATQKNNAD